MKVILNFEEDRYKVTVITGRKVFKTNNIENVASIIADIPSNPTFALPYKDDLKLFYGLDKQLVLKDYKKNLNEEYFKFICDGIDQKTHIVKSLSKTNKKRIAALALTGVIFTSIALPKKTNEDSVNDNYTISSNEDKINEVTPNNNFEISIEDTKPSNIVINDSQFELSSRLNQTSFLQRENINNPNIKIGTRLDEYSINVITNFINSDIGKYCFDTCNDFGVDPYVFVSLMTAESSLNHKDTIPGGEKYNGFGVGYCQLESPSGQKITAFNYNTNLEETIYETMENACDEKLNIKMGIMRFQNVLQRYNGNQYLAIQAHNYGYGLIDLIVNIYANEMGLSISDVTKNFGDTGWIKYVKEANQNPQAFAYKYQNYTNYNVTINYLKNWQYGTYGNGKYLEDVLGYYIGEQSKIIVNGDPFMFSFLDNSFTKLNENSHHI